MKETFDIYGMTCASCAAHVQKAVESVPGATDVQVNLLKNSLQVDVSDERTLSQISQAIHDAGYEGVLTQENGGVAGGAGVEAESGVGVPPAGKAFASELADPALSARRRTGSMKANLTASIIFCVPLFYLAMGSHMGWPLPGFITGANHLLLAAFVQFLLLIPILMINLHFFSSGFRALRHGAPNMDSLIFLSAGASTLYGIYSFMVMLNAAGLGEVQQVMTASNSMYFDSAAMIITLISLGKYLEARAKGHTTDAISNLYDLAPKEALIIREGKEVTIPTSQVVPGDQVIVKAGCTIPVDGVVSGGEAYVDQAAITGESVPVKKRPGDQVIGATQVKQGYLHVEAVSVGSDTALAHIIRIVDEATSTKAPVERIVDTVSGVFVPVVMAISVVTLIGWLVAGAAFNTAFGYAISVLVISCPCALGLATPTAVMVATGRGAQKGILVKSAQALEAAGKVDYVVLDKTGTLTEGKPEVVDCLEVADAGTGEARVVLASSHDLPLETKAVAYALESRSEHPLSAAVVDFVQPADGNQKDKLDLQVDQFAQLEGAGITGLIDGKQAFLGNERLAEQQRVDLSAVLSRAKALKKQAKTVVYLGYDGKLLAVFAIADRMKEDAPAAIAALRQMGLVPVLLTGDSSEVAASIGKQAGIDADHIISQALPEGKAKEVRRLESQGHKVAMVGDGINDAPALVAATVGVAIGAGTDIALDSADLVLMHSDPFDVVRAIDLSRATLRNIKENLFWAFFYNVICIPLAAGLTFGLPIVMNPMVGAAAMSLSSLFVVTNALRLNGWKCRYRPERFLASTSVSSAEAAASGGCKLGIPNEGQIETQEVSYNAEQVDTKEPIHKEEHPMKTITLNVAGMSCNHCVNHVTRSLEQVPGVSRVWVSLEDGKAVVTGEDRLDFQQLIKAVVACGYEAELA